MREWKVLSERVPVHEEMYFPARDTWVDVSAYPTRGGGFAVFHRDVGDRKRAEQAERERLEQEVEVRERRFIQLFQSMLEAVQIAELVRDERGRVVDVRMLDINPAYEVHTGLSREQVVGRLGSEFTTLEPMFLEHVERVIATGEPVRFEEYNAGLARWFDISVFSLAEGDRFAAVFKDTTERRRTEQALREADRRKDEFLAMLSHELRNPLGAISNAVFLLEQTRDQGRAERARMVIERQTRHLTRMIDDLLDVTRISRGKIKLVREPVELRELVRSAIEDQRELFASKASRSSSSTPIAACRSTPIRPGSRR
ncbi:MAG: PAS domain S-box protein [Deltaproteobacteria bacterium]|nr:PAS domain S-box protein [Deltaproteobacteria bacterium]